MYFTQASIHPYWSNIPSTNWNDWTWQIKNRVTEPEKLQEILGISDEETRDISRSLTTLRMAITPYYLSQIEPDNPMDPIRLQAIPTFQETIVSKEDSDDPLHEEEDCPPGLEGILTHRYPDRLIIYATYQCAMYCRHCTRRRRAGETDTPTPFSKIEQAVEYVRKTKSIRDVLITGGDPLTLPTAYLEKIIKSVRSVSHVEVIRIGTRTPITLPMRVTDELCSMLKKYHPLWINTHFNHPREMTDLSSVACNRLADAGIPLGNQSVLLKRVNNHPMIFRKLVKLLVANRVRPYYIYQCDLSQGLNHFRTRIAEGVEIIENLRGHVSGFAVPTFVVDGIGGGGKTPVGPNYVLSQGNNKWVLRNYEGMVFSYTEPENYIYEAPLDIDRYADQIDIQSQTGVAELLSDKGTTNITPKNLARLKRRTRG